MSIAAVVSTGAPPPPAEPWEDAEEPTGTYSEFLFAVFAACLSFVSFLSVDAFSRFI